MHDLGSAVRLGLTCWWVIGVRWSTLSVYLGLLRVVIVVVVAAAAVVVVVVVVGVVVVVAVVKGAVFISRCLSVSVSVSASHSV